MVAAVPFGLGWPGSSAGALVDGLLERLSGIPLADDVTAIVLRRLHAVSDRHGTLADPRPGPADGDGVRTAAQGASRGV